MERLLPDGWAGIEEDGRLGAAVGGPEAVNLLVVAGLVFTGVGVAFGFASWEDDVTRLAGVEAGQE